MRSPVDLKAAVERLRLQAVKKMEAYAFDEAAELLDRALAISRDEEQTELLRLDKALVLLELGEDGPEVRALPEILMRRRNPRHTVLAARALQRKSFEANEFEESIRFGRMALHAVGGIGDRVWEASILTELGGASAALDRFRDAIQYHRSALARMHPSNRVGRAAVLENLGFAYWQIGQIDRGIRYIKKALVAFEMAGLDEFRAEVLLDLCGAFLESAELDLARESGRECLSLARDPRHVRNCHFLLGEIAMRRRALEEARQHFRVLAAFYPDFPALPHMLLSFDIGLMLGRSVRGVVHVTTSQVQFCGCTQDAVSQEGRDMIGRGRSARLRKCV